ALIEQGQTVEGMTQVRQGLAIYQATGTELSKSFFLLLLAEAYRRTGQTAEGLTLLAEAQEFVGTTGERLYEAELYRLKGELVLQSGVKTPKSAIRFGLDVPLAMQSEAEACFHKAINIAHRQGAKSLELRAVMGLSRLWQRQGKKKKARQMLAEIYGWFTEGFDTKDLQEAKTLLRELPR